MTSDLETNVVSVERVKEYSETPTEVDLDLWLLRHVTYKCAVVSLG